MCFLSHRRKLDIRLVTHQIKRLQDRLRQEEEGCSRKMMMIYLRKLPQNLPRKVWMYILILCCSYTRRLIDYSLIAFDERVTFWLQRVRSLPCACAYVALFARRLAYNYYAHTHTMQQQHAQGSDRAR